MHKGGPTQIAELHDIADIVEDIVRIDRNDHDRMKEVKSQGYVFGFWHMGDIHYVKPTQKVLDIFRNSDAFTGSLPSKLSPESVSNSRKPPYYWCINDHHGIGRYAIGTTDTRDLPVEA